MGFPILVRWHVYIESGPRLFNMFICSVPQVPQEALAAPAPQEALASLDQRVNLATLVARVVPAHPAHPALMVHLAPLVHPVVPVVPVRLDHLALVADPVQQDLQASKDLRAILAILVSSWWRHDMLKHFAHYWSFVKKSIVYQLIHSQRSRNDRIWHVLVNLSKLLNKRSRCQRLDMAWR